MLRTKRTNKIENAVQQFLRSVIDTERKAERRSDSRIDISIVVAIIPVVDGEPQLDRAFATPTKNISSDGISLVVNRNVPEDKLLIGFPGATLSFVRADVLYRERMALGCSKLGLRMQEMVDTSDFPALAKFCLQ
jgi:hypothetical protein